MTIALDTTSSAGNQSSYPITISHTCTGSNLLLIVGITCASTAQAVISTVTYNALGMTQIAAVDEHTNQNRQSWLFYYIGPATGAHNIVVSFTTPPDTFTSVGAASYTGAKQSGQPDQSGTSTSGASTVTSASKSITTVADNCWMVGVSCNGGGTTDTANGGTTLRLSVYQRTVVGYELYLMDTNGPLTPAGANSLGYTWSGGAARQNTIVASISPAAGVAVTAFPSLLGLLL